MSNENTQVQNQLTPEQQQKQIAKNKINTLKATLAAPSVLEQFKNVLADNSGPFIASIIDLYNGDNNLQKCEPNQVIFEALKAASLKLPVNKSLGFAYIYAFGTTATMIIGYKGYIQLAMRTGQYRIINADVVYEGEFRSKKKLTGEFDLEGERVSDKIVGYFAHFEIINGFTKTLYMTVQQVKDWAQKYSPAYRSNNKIWKDEFDKMAMKTVLRNLLSHWGYMSVEMANAMNKDSDFEDTESQVMEDIKQNANTSSLSFDDAVIVDDKAKDQTVQNKPADNKPNPGAGLQPNLNFDQKSESTIKPEFS